MKFNQGCEVGEILAMFKVELMPLKQTQLHMSDIRHAINWYDICLSFPQVMEKLNVNTFWDFLTMLQHLTQTVLHMVESNSQNLLTPSDVLYLSQIIEMDPTGPGSTHFVGANLAKIMVSIATNYMKVAGFLLEPHMATQWMGRTEDGVRGLFMHLYCL